MILYHFCPAHLVERIKKQGLTLGMIPLVGGRHITIVSGYQWLTSNPDPKKQSWSTSENIRYSRTEIRLTIDIPKRKMKKVWRATDFVKGLPKEQRGFVENWGGSEDWRLYAGEIPPQWIIAVEKTGEGGIEG